VTLHRLDRAPADGQIGRKLGDVLRIAATVSCTIAEGPFRRFAIWVRGCSLRCPGCCNPELFEPGGEPVAIAAIGLRSARDLHGLEGITILGGEPLEQIEGVTALALHACALGLGVIVFTGYTLEEAEARPGFDRLWSALDTLVDGRFEARARDPVRRFVGSTNQRLNHRTDRYADPALWRGGKRLEIHVGAGDLLHIHGDPAAARRVVGSARWRSRPPASG
jgi:anaerobic ribonucleoside-triphosphate reductase activating protein